MLSRLHPIGLAVAGVATAFAVFAATWAIIALTLWAVLLVGTMLGAALRSWRLWKANRRARALIHHAGNTAPDRIDREGQRIRRRRSAAPSRIAISFSSHATYSTDDEVAAETLISFVNEWANGARR